MEVGRPLEMGCRYLEEEVIVTSTIFWVVALCANVKTSGSIAKANEGGDGVVEVKSTTVLFDALASGEMEYPLLTRAKGGIFDETDLK